METVSLKLQKSTLMTIKKLSKMFHYDTKTEFIREAIRDKLKELETEIFMRGLKRFKGASEIKVSDRRLHEIREKIAKEYLRS